MTTGIWSKYLLLLPVLTWTIYAYLFSGPHHFPPFRANEAPPIDARAEGDVSTSLLRSKKEDENDNFADSPIMLSNVSRRADYSCSAKNPCSNGACCGASGFCGYGPKYCGKGCKANCDAAAECGQFAQPPNKKCPLNVCCSQYGFCGTTTEFCGNKCQSNCIEHPKPSGPKSDRDIRKRVIGYYEAWSAKRKCHSMNPSGIPIDALTHVNFAFASIKPDTYEITTMDEATSAKLFQSAADVKTFNSGNSDLEVFISIGGWTFSDNHTATQPLFGEIAADSSKRQEFANNVLKFVDQYGFDGVDLDWEYPGAPDRGGHPNDGDNYVELVKTLRQTFDASPRNLGLTFTIPTSYWYLRWFNLPGMLPHIDWINMMSYDLHGTWDASNPIGNIVQGHTNLTEIKLAAELLWRVNVPPKKVVMGFAFYGRSFQLANPTCAHPGCPFTGTAKPGPCTKTGGFLAYFEIMQILKGVTASSGGGTTKLKRDVIQPIHDKKDAVNYFKYDHDQWVSYDNKDTFKQKADWANDIGLSGAMIWATDLDDNNFPALAGLTGPQIVQGLMHPNDGKSVKQDWSGESGEQCRRNEECVAIGMPTVPKCNPHEQYVGWDQGGCGKSNGQQYGKAICCPVMAYPRNCIWRGGGLDCDGQCHSGETTLFMSSWGGGPTDGNQKRCSRGRKVFCCVAAHWKELIGDCYFGNCGGGCNSNNDAAVTWKHDPQICSYMVGHSGPTNRDFCCPKPRKFKGCHWVGKGDCAQNSCDNNDIELMTDNYGDSSHSCYWGRQKVCCCNSPNEHAFPPVPLRKLFPTKPPANDFMRFDLQFPKGRPSGGDPAHSPFGWVVIEGPKSVVVSSKVKRDGSPSDLRFLNCHEVDGKGYQRVRFVCDASGAESDCDDMMEGGISGTIIEMPESCGPGTYAVAHEVSHASDQTLPPHLSHISNRTVMELTFGYDFSLVKRDSGDVYFRVDYSNVGNYWTQAVSAQPVTRRSLDRRFFSSKISAWSSVFSDWLKNSVGGGTSFTQDLGKTLFSDVQDCGGNTAYANIATSGSVRTNGRMALSMVGTISPSLNVEEIYAIMDTSIEANMHLDAYLDGNFSLPYTMAPFSSPQTLDAFNHIGLVSITPKFELDVALKADADVSGNFSTGVHAFTSQNIIQTWPGTVRDATGQTKQETVSVKGSDTGFLGFVDTIGKPGRIKVDLLPKIGMQIELNKYGTDSQLLNAFIDSSFDTYNSLDVDGSGSFKMSMGTTQASGELNYIGSANELSEWGNDNEASRNIGTANPAKVIDSGEVGKKGKSGPPSEEINHDANAVFASHKELLQCSNKRRKCRDKDYDCAYNICQRDPGYCDDYDAEPSSGGNAGSSRRRDLLVKRGKARPFDFEFTDGSEFSIKSRPYPSVGELFDGRNSLRVVKGLFDYVDPRSCSNVDVIDSPMDDEALSGYVTEHILELQTIPRFLQSAQSGILPSGATMSNPIPASFFHENWNEESLPNDLPSVVSTNSYSPNVPNTRVFEALGSKINRKNFVATLEEINSVKARLWDLRAPLRQEKFDARVSGWLLACENPATFIKYLKAARAVFSYMTDLDVNERLRDQVSLVRTQLSLIEQNTQGGQGLAGIWDVYIDDHLQIVSEHARTWMDNRITEVRAALLGANPRPENAPQVLADLSALQSTVSGIHSPLGS